MKDKRFIEYSFPIKEVSEQGAKEKNIRHGHISTLHIWWARRPLATSRATNFASLIPAPNDKKEYENKKNFISDLSKWENSLNKEIIDKAREDILAANNGIPPKVLDPFGGGGAIPLEALRLGCEVYSNDYNPVAVLIQKSTLEFPQKYKDKKIKVKNNLGLYDEEPALIYDVEKWGNYVLEEAKKEIGKFYPNDEDGFIPVGYIWARTIPCQNPTCGAEIPLMRQFWLANKSNKKVSLYPYVEGKEVKFKIVGDGYEPIPKDFDPSKGTVSRAIATCPVCGGVVEADKTRELFREGKSGERLIAVVLHKEGEQGKRYRIATQKNFEIFKETEKNLEEKRKKLMEEWGINPVPDEPMNQNDPTTVAGRGYGFTTWGQLFNSRQKLALITFTEKVRNAYKEMINEGYDEEYAKAVVSYLGLAIDKIAVYSSTFGYWHNTRELVNPALGKQAIQMTWDYAETNSFGGNADFYSALNWIKRYLEHFTKIPVNKNKVEITHSSATNLPYSDNYFDAVFTDPPYYDNINYAELSDFFYVWLKRSIGDLYPDLFITPLVPKSQEIVANPSRQGNVKKAKQFFEDMLKKSFQEIYRVLKPDGITVIVYAHKSTEGWETLVNSLLDSGLVITAAYPLDTEMMNKVKAHGTASLASSIYIVARKIEKEEVGFYNDVKEELKQYLNQKLDLLWKEGISGADFFISAIGSAIEVFGKYKSVIDYKGNVVRADKLLDDVREIVIDYAIKEILHNGFANQISDLTKFYILWRFNWQEARVHFDEARKLAQTIGINLEEEWNKGFIKKEKEFVRLLSADKRKIDEIKPKDLIDVLHLTLKLWEKSKTEELIKLLSETGYGKSDVFFRVAQAISECLPLDSKEKKLIDGFLTGKERIVKQVSSAESSKLRYISVDDLLKDLGGD
jgi:adenine-specific DNA methylase